MTFPFPCIEEPPHGKVPASSDGMFDAIRALERKTERMYERLIAAEHKIAELRAALNKYTEWL